ncbi:hypothetical protein GH714_018172 [Hevea brasiliensis]|uniref:SAC domain-containing protein n=1 Tax=Hevea brasiliensis TaxID=3981 RepID=A0A6A6LK43_HEVBR|nr:hypothetical protein GH714_018172 [Hevea brasiliensis]
MIGRDKNRTFWRVLKIDRLEPSELCILEDSTIYSESECCDLLRRIHEGNKSTGGLRFVTTSYGIVGFIKFLGPYYMLLITKRRKIGAICGHAIYAITKSEMIPIPNSSVRSNMTNSKNENRYKKLLCTMDLTRDFFFSYSYHVMHCLQKNLYNNKIGKAHYETMFVWNEFLTQGIRNNLKNTLWTVALVYGFFKQVKLSASGRDFKLTLIARRSRHYAGTRYLKRGVNDKGRVANDVETEQIVFEDIPEGYPVQISSVVQHRGSIPLFWSQETSRLNIKPDIRLLKKDQNYEATKLHFENLAKRYGNPIIILNLIKSYQCVVTSWESGSICIELDWHLLLSVTPSLRPMGLLSYSEKNDDECSLKNPSNENDLGRHLDSGIGNVDCEANGNQKSPIIDLDNPLAEDLMGIYETMGDTLALQYGGSAAHNKIFCERRGQWKAATQSQEFFRTLQRYYSNAYMDAEKQDAINVFLGHFQPQQGKPALWELDSDQHYNVGGRGPDFVDEDARSFVKKSLSDGNLVAATKVGHDKPFSEEQGVNKGLSDLTPEISTCESDISYSRYTPSMPRQQLFKNTGEDEYFDSDHICYEEHGDACSCSNFLDMDWLSSSGNSCEEDPSDRSIAGLSSEYLMNELKSETSASESGSSLKGRNQTADDLSSEDVMGGLSERFLHWDVDYQTENTKQENIVKITLSTGPAFLEANVSLKSCGIFELCTPESRRVDFVERYKTPVDSNG